MLRENDLEAEAQRSLHLQMAELALGPGQSMRLVRTEKLYSQRPADDRFLCPFFLFSKIFNVYLFIFEKERDRAGAGKEQRRKHGIQSRLQALSCQHRAQRRPQIHELGDHDLN